VHEVVDSSSEHEASDEDDMPIAAMASRSALKFHRPHHRLFLDPLAKRLSESEKKELEARLTQMRFQSLHNGDRPVGIAAGQGKGSPNCA